MFRWTSISRSALSLTKRPPSMADVSRKASVTGPGLPVSADVARRGKDDPGWPSMEAWVECSGQD
jgi:hypothetical protein